MLCWYIPLRRKTAARGAYREHKAVATSHPPTSVYLCTPGYIIARGLRVVPLTGHNLVNDIFQLGLSLPLLPMVLGGLGRDPG